MPPRVGARAGLPVVRLQTQLRYSWIQLDTAVVLPGIAIDTAVVQLRPVVLLLIEFYPEFLLSLRFKPIHVRVSFVVKYVHPLLNCPSDVIAMTKTSQLCRKYIHNFR